MKVCILTINREKASFKKLLQYFDCSVLSIYDGYTPKDLTSKETYYSTRLRRDIGPAEYCCRLGHLQILRDFLNSNEDMCMILEDDIEFRIAEINLLNLLKRIRNDPHIKENPSILLLGAQNGITQNKMLFGKKLNNELFLIPNLYTRFAWRTAAYVVNRSAAKSLIQTHEENLSVIDDWKMASDKGVKLLFSNVSDHPVDMTLSHINHERSVRQHVALYRKYAHTIFTMISRAIGLKKL